MAHEHVDQILHQVGCEEGHQIEGYQDHPRRIAHQVLLEVRGWQQQQCLPVVLAIHAVEHKRGAHHYSDKEYSKSSYDACLIADTLLGHHDPVRINGEKHIQQHHDDQHLQERLHVVLLVVHQRPARQFCESIKTKLYHKV